MKAKEIYKLWSEYATKNRDRFAKLENNHELGVIFGTDEVKIDKKKKRIRLPKIGWVDFPEMEINFKPDWIVMTNDNWFTVGDGDPFSKEMIEVLPQSDGLITVIPFGVSNDF